MTLTAQLGRCRRRLFVVAAARYAGLLVPGAIVLSEIGVLIARPPPSLGVLLAASSIGVALLVSTVAAAMRIPSLRETALAVDRRLNLQDRTVTAVQVLHGADPMSRLVVRDAAARIAHLSPARTFPLEPPARFRTALVAAGALSALLLAAVGAPRVRDVASGRGDGVTASRAMASGVARPTDAPLSPADVQAASPTAGAVAAAGPERPESPPSEAPPRSDMATAGRSTQQGERQTSSHSSGDSAASIATGSASEARSRADGSTGSRGGPEGRAGAPARDAAGAAWAGSGGRGAAGLLRSAAVAAGGVSGGLQIEGDRRSPDAALAAGQERDATYAARYRAASARAEAAIAQERVPARLRTYVKSYFMAIRP